MILFIMLEGDSAGKHLLLYQQFKRGAAQLVERLLPTPQVRGSITVTSENLY